MRTLALLAAAALLLLALPANAKSLRETDDQVPAQDLSEALELDQLEAEDQNQPGAEGQDMAISFGGAKRLVLGASGLRRVTVCYCRRTPCYKDEYLSGTCTLGGIRHLLCCH